MRSIRRDYAAQEIVRGTREQGGLFTTDDLASWQVKIEEPLSTTYKGIEVFKLAQWQQGPVMLQALSILEPLDVKAMGYNSPRYLHTLYQTMNAADAAGWVISVTPSGGWIPAVIAGRTGIGLSQRAQSFVFDPAGNPFNVMEPGKRPRVTLTPTLALRDGLPWMAFSVQGGDSQDQNLLQAFLNIVEFGMTPQQAVEAPNMNSFQMRNSSQDHTSRPGRMLVAASTPLAVREQLQKMGYTLEFAERTSGPITAIWFDRRHGTMWGAASNHGEDYGIAW